MIVILVHGLGRTTLSMKRLGRALERAGATPVYFGYVAAFESIESIVARLQQRLTGIAAAGEYAAVGHSLGGLLLRAAIARLPDGVERPRHVVMLGTPHSTPRLAQRFEASWWYRLLNGDAGRMLASPERMRDIPLPSVPVTLIAGTVGPRAFLWSRFEGEPHDGIVAVSEARIGGDEEFVTLPVRHPWMMNDREVVRLVVERCARREP